MSPNIRESILYLPIDRNSLIDERQVMPPLADHHSNTETGKSNKEILRFGGGCTEPAGQKMDERDFDRCLLFSGNYDVNRLGIEGGGADEAGCDIAVETAVWAREDV
jgi:hypothetical protein